MQSGTLANESRAPAVPGWGNVLPRRVREWEFRFSSFYQSRKGAQLRASKMRWCLCGIHRGASGPLSSWTNKCASFCIDQKRSRYNPTVPDEAGSDIFCQLVVFSVFWKVCLQVLSVVPPAWTTSRDLRWLRKPSEPTALLMLPICTRTSQSCQLPDILGHLYFKVQTLLLCCCLCCCQMEILYRIQSRSKGNRILINILQSEDRNKVGYWRLITKAPKQILGNVCMYRHCLF